MEPIEPTLPLFDQEPARPLADRLRPTQLDEVVGQDHLLAPDAPLGRMVAQQRLGSAILWGPPGVGKTTIARLLADGSNLTFESVSATFSGVADLRKVFAAARNRRGVGQGTLLFVDEIHRFNRAEQLTGHPLPLDDDARRALIAMADGDGRYLLNMAEQLQALPDTETPLDTTALAHHIQQRAPLYDKAQESHYNLISALHKSMRGSDPDAALYWLARMLDGGEDPLYVARRLVRFASEDIGMADPHAIQQTLAAWDVYERLGSPEGELAIAQAVVYLATAPKSIAVYRGFNAAHSAARRTGSLMPPAHILNAPTRLMKNLGYGKGYQYDPDTTDGFSGADYFPDDMDRETYYQPTQNGHEIEIAERLRQWATSRARRQRG
jgi:putative ATPase